MNKIKILIVGLILSIITPANSTSVFDTFTPEEQERLLIEMEAFKKSSMTLYKEVSTERVRIVELTLMQVAETEQEKQMISNVFRMGFAVGYTTGEN